MELFVIRELRHQRLSISAIAPHTGLDSKTRMRVLEKGLSQAASGRRLGRPSRPPTPPYVRTGPTPHYNCSILALAVSVKLYGMSLSTGSSI